MQMRRVISLALALPLVIAAAACGGSSTAPTTVSSIAVTGTVPAIGGTAQFAATATMSNGTTQDVTSTATWASTNTAEATVSASGLVTGVAAGTVTIQATYQTVTGSDQITLAP